MSFIVYAREGRVVTNSDHVDTIPFLRNKLPTSGNQMLASSVLQFAVKLVLSPIIFTSTLEVSVEE